MEMEICPAEKEKYLKAYSCYDWQDRNSLAEVIQMIPTPDFDPYPETPNNAVIFATTGTDGCHYCMLPYNDTILIYLVLPNMGYEKSVYLIGHSMSEVLSYSLSILGLFECVFDLDKKSFLSEFKKDRLEQKKPMKSKSFKRDFQELSKTYQINRIPPQEVYDRLRKLNGL